MPIIDRTQVHEQVALPGDPHLDADIENIQVTAVVVDHDDHELLVHLRGGHGRWASADTGDMVNVGEVSHADVRARFVDLPDTMWQRIVDQLQQWRDAGTPLWFGSVPGKVSALIEDPGHYLFLPRRPDPLEQ